MLLEREAFLETLQVAKTQAAAGRGHTVLIEGEAGIGKTALLQEFARRAGDDGRFVWGWCEALSTPRPLGPLQDMAPSFDASVASLLDQTARPDRLFPALLRSIQEAPQAMVFIIEDIHWADAATMDFVKYLGRRISVLRALLVLSTRSDEVGADHPLTHVVGDLPSRAVTRMKLSPLSAAAVAELAAHAGRTGEDLHTVTAGNPFFVTELLASSEGAANRIPDSIRDAVWSRLSRMSHAERAVLEAMSVIPGSVEMRLIREMLGRTGEGMVDRCVARGLLRRDVNGDVTFRHELSRQATLERLPPSVQRTLHGKVEAALAILYASDVAQLARRVHHAAGAEDGAKVLELAQRAAQHAAQVGAHQQAAAYLEMALKHVDLADAQTAAQLYENWAYESGLNLLDYNATIEAHRRSIALWRDLARSDHISLNLRRLSRLYWRLGEGDESVRYSNLAVEESEKAGPGPELAMVYSTRSQLNMLHYRFDAAIEWGTRAIEIADSIGEIETRVHALNNVGSARLFTGDIAGKAYMEESLALALKHGYHDHAARAYTNYAEYAVVFKEFELAERLFAEGIAFAARNDLDSPTQYLLGRQAQLRLEQGRFREAETIAQGVIRIERLPRVMHLPALTVLGLVRVRLDEAGGVAALQQALVEGLPTGEPQRIMPVRMALTEAAWLSEDLSAAHEQLAALAALGTERLRPWDIGELAVWWRRCKMPGSLNINPSSIPAVRALELAGEAGAAAQEWERLGLPYEAALSLMQTTGAGAGDSLRRAVALLDPLEGRAAATLARRFATRAGLVELLPKTRRGPYAASRRHPLGLTHNEQQVLAMIAVGKSNKEIARQVARSPRTIEHQVSAVLAKFNAANRMEVVLRLRSEPWLLASEISAPMQS